MPLGDYLHGRMQRESGKRLGEEYHKAVFFIVSTPTFAGSDRSGGSSHWRGDLALLVFFLFWAGNRK